MTCRPRTGLAGFTLIEVLVALTIIAFGLIAVFGQLSQSASAASRLRDKTLAHWVALNKVTELRLKGGFPSAGVQSDDIEMANTRWHYEIKISETASDQLRRADVTVSLEEDPDRPLATAIGFVGKPPAARGQSAARSGWPLVSPDGSPAGGETQEDSKPTPTPDPKPDNSPDGAQK